ncbi:antibiotic biosynthesis monooxygenase [Streptomyces sp. RLB3-17]|jgi:antibiotic biosynthesis monooxygenase (ABM) superfamily enzyme|uniref:Antibiotic biosynthesis monooxygenase n=1 Tax=Streptomyces mirabilis TaxID=68239 RepID=A0ABU3US31_9ACTN|nr:MULTISPECIES: antibiotic biosynthesis monooxygenase [Streptomyces]QDO20646.1 antibiotic biosynthesis monooxygenase [Streptomyces sp. S1A1-8]QDO30772.1 antibiotic biosynthesis monooxygenase [Streptomyces sp. S1A1-3]MCX5349877.1 antibiotic biosynthesis monooxygenase [Streptomyces mirabilis]MDU8996739.1 antibiotic biosynthesis monooxygenase [Streptomyces mirabilis]QDN88296.1 antibiotic biosynthesis monooxygenase [Streptomyces sp. RLB3-6]
MSDRASAAPGGGGATVVTSQKVREGRGDEYERWQEKTNRVVRDFDGFEGTEMYPPGPAGEREWVVVFRFSRIDQLTAWLDSGARRDLLAEGRPLLEGAPTQEVLAGAASAPPREAVTAVVSHDVRPGREQDFERWQDKVLKAQEKFPGFMGSELFKPVEGIQEHWVVIFRFDNRQHLEDWLGSDSRAELLQEGDDYFFSYDVRKVGTAFSGWFRFGEGTEEGVPPNWKQAMCVVLALYPTVMVLNLTVGHEFGVLGISTSVGLFLSNVLSVSILTWVLMPLVNRALAFWLLPSRSRSLRTHVAGAAVVVLCWLIFIAVFSLTTN